MGNFSKKRGFWRSWSSCFIFAEGVGVCALRGLNMRTTKLFLCGCPYKRFRGGV
jgi:hypothetical protein